MVFYCTQEKHIMKENKLYPVSFVGNFPPETTATMKIYLRRAFPNSQKQYRETSALHIIKWYTSHTDIAQLDVVLSLKPTTINWQGHSFVQEVHNNTCFMRAKISAVNMKTPSTKWNDRFKHGTADNVLNRAACITSPDNEASRKTTPAIITVWFLWWVLSPHQRALLTLWPVWSRDKSSSDVRAIFVV